MYRLLVPLFLFLVMDGFAQKKPLDHTVYDGWQTVTQAVMSADGQWVAYQVAPQEGDGQLVISRTDGSNRQVFERGYGLVFSDDARFLVFRIRAFFKETREARIKKKRPDDMPKDSLAILELATGKLWKTARVRSFKLPEEGTMYLAYHREKALPTPAAAPAPMDSITRINRMLTMADSLARVADSLRNKAKEAQVKGLSVLPSGRSGSRSPGRTPEEPVEEGTELVLRNLVTGAETIYPLVLDYYFSKKGQALVLKCSRKNNDTLSKARILWIKPGQGTVDTVFTGFNDAKGFALDEAGEQLAFVAERDSSAKALQKFYRLWYFRQGMNSAVLQASRGSEGVPAGLTISPDYNNQFSADGKRLFLGLAPVRKPKDTTLVEFETARLDIWHYKEDYLQTQQLYQLNNELRRSYLAVIKPGSGVVTPLGDPDLEQVELADRGNGLLALGSTNQPYRLQSQWEQGNYRDVYLVHAETGKRTLVARKRRGGANLSPNGSFVVWYDWKQRHYFAYETATGITRNVTAAIKVPLWDEEDEHPDDPPPAGWMGWLEQQGQFLVYDKYDIWQIDPTGKEQPKCITGGMGRLHRHRFRYVRTDADEQFVRTGQTAVLRVFNEQTKGAGTHLHKLGESFGWTPGPGTTGNYGITTYFKAAKQMKLGYLKGSYQSSYDVFVVSNIDSSKRTTAGGEVTSYQLGAEQQLSQINPQQQQYNWGTAELFKWKAYNGKWSEGIVYKPENFDPRKKYPMICYFYETHSETLHQYQAPAPTPSRLNISFYVSRGYIVFSPDIHYTTGQPARDCYNYVVSGARALVKLGFVDSTRMGIQGQSWGGIQVAQLVTMTPLFAAAWSGAPVANMTSAYGGIRWESGINRQFQYEKSQSRIGATLWEKLPLYLENSPLFHLPKVKTPIAIMANDADGAVPWYQGIELFTGLRRLGKASWMLNYNGEAHNLVERRNRKDIQIRQQQFFDHYLMGAPMPRWMKTGVPATEKGIEWGLETE